VKPFGAIRALSEEEEERIHETMLRIVSEVGLRVENDEMVARLSDYGARVSDDRQTITFAPEFVEEFIAQSEKFDWENVAEHHSEGRTHEHPVTIGTRRCGLLARYC